jgi:2-polyprenyl-6-methoxyphenol hydroxylase-like FAD-dependent oxidoreductase
LTDKPEILIVGAGPTGLSAAIELARLGILPTIVDRRTTVTGHSRAVAIQASALDLLRPSGVVEPIIRDAVHITAMRIFHNNKTLLRLAMDKVDDPLVAIYGLGQDRFERHLYDALERYGVAVQFGTELTELTQTDEAVQVTLNGGKSTFDYVIAADGVHSFIRKSLGIAFVGEELPGRWSVADISADNWPDPEETKVYLLPGALAGVAVPIAPGQFRIVANTVDIETTLPASLCNVEIKDKGEYVVNERQAEQYAKGRVFLAGDSAHTHSPVDGRGMNMGIADAVCIAQRLVNGTPEGYHSERHTAGIYALRMAQIARRAATTPRGHKQLLFRTICRIARIGFLNKAAARRLAHNFKP